mgnify:CR=1 FL=1
MKRISFKDSNYLYLTASVLKGKKTMTRRAVKLGPPYYQSNVEIVMREKPLEAELWLKYGDLMCVARPKYEVGDIVAIQQSYKYLAEQVPFYKMACENLDEYETHKGWANKMFVSASLMPHHIRITDVRLEWLQDISDEDCLREGVWGITKKGKYFYDYKLNYNGFDAPRDAFASLIDEVSGRGTWNSNPLVWCYSFELVD